MFTLLSKKAIRLYRIASTISHDKESVSVEAIQRMNNCSLKTVYEDLRFLDEEYGSLFEERFSAQTLSEVDILESQLIEFRRILLSETLEIQIFDLLVTKKSLSLYELCYRLNYSDTTVRRALDNLIEFISPYHLEIVKDSNSNYQMKGNTLSMLVLTEKYIDSDNVMNLLTGEDRQKINALAAEAKTEFHRYLHTFLKRNVYKLCAIENYLGLTYLNERLEALINNKETIVLEKELLRSILETTLAEERIHFNDEKLDLMVDVLYIYQLYSLELNKNICGDFSVKRVFYSKIRDANPEHIELYERVINKLSQETQTDFGEYQSNIFHLIYPFLIWIDDNPKVRIGLCPEKHCVHGELYKKIIESEFKNCEVEEYQETEDYDFIVSNDVFFEKDDMKVIYVNDYLLEENLITIYEAIVEARRSFAQSHEKQWA